MQCESCKEREATIEFTTVAGDEKKTSNLCAVCAAAVSQQQAKATEEDQSDELAGKATPVKKKKVNVVVGHLSKSEAKTKACPDCGMTYDEFRKIGRLGCSSCYQAFAKPLKRLLKRIHGADHHTGRSPGMPGPSPKQDQADEVDSLGKLRDELSKAVEDEEYERAAQLRDQITRLQLEDSQDA